MNPFKFLTDMEDRNAVLEEMSKKYKGTILCINSPGQQYSYGNYRGHSDDMKTLYFNILSKDNEPIECIIDYNQEIEVTIPKLELGCYTAGNKLVVLQTLPHRQWKKGLCDGNTIIYSPYEPADYGTKNYFNNYIHEILLENQEQQTITTAVEKLKTNNTLLGTHINRNFGLIENFFNADPFYFLYHYQFLIGKVYPEEQRILVENKHFLQEVLDAKQELGYNYRIEV